MPRPTCPPFFPSRHDTPNAQAPGHQPQHVGLGQRAAPRPCAGRQRAACAGAHRHRPLWRTLYFRRSQLRRGRPRHAGRLGRRAGERPRWRAAGAARRGADRLLWRPRPAGAAREQPSAGDRAGRSGLYRGGASWALCHRHRWRTLGADAAAAGPDARPCAAAGRHPHRGAYRRTARRRPGSRTRAAQPGLPRRSAPAGRENRDFGRRGSGRYGRCHSAGTGRAHHRQRAGGCPLGFAPPRPAAAAPHSGL